METENKLYDYLVKKGYIVTTDLDTDNVQFMDEDEEALIGYIFSVEDEDGTPYVIQFDIINHDDGLYAMWEVKDVEWFIDEVVIK